MAERASQIAGRTLIQPSAPVGQVSQVAGRVLMVPSAPVARVSQVAARVLITYTPTGAGARAYVLWHE